MAQFTNVAYSGSYGGSGSGTDPDFGPFDVTTSGTLTTTLSQDAASNVSGTWSYSGSSTSSGSFGTEIISVSDAGTVSGTVSSLTFTSDSGVFVNGTGLLTNNDTSISVTATFVFVGGSGSASGSMTGSPPTDTTPPPEDPATVTFDTVAPAPVQWTTDVAVPTGSRFVSPQFQVDDITGAWSLKAYSVAGGVGFNPADVAYFTGVAKDTLLGTVKDAAQEEVHGFIVDSLGEHTGQKLISLFESAQMAHAYYGAASTYATDMIALLPDAAEAAAGLRSPDEVQERIDTVRNAFTQQLGDILLPDAVKDAIGALKWFLTRSDYSFGLESGSGTYAGAEHRDVFLGGAAGDVFYGGTNDDIAFGSVGNDVMQGEDGNDQLYGGSGDDRLAGGAGDDTLNGGSGVDTAVYSGASSAYAVVYDGVTGRYAVTSAADGQDGLSGIERVAFSDLVVTLTSTLSGKTYFWNKVASQGSNAAGHVLLDGVTVSADDGGIAREGMSAAGGAYSVADIAASTTPVSASQAVSTADKATVTLGDALEVLKLYLGKLANPSPYKYLAADFNADNKVTLADALAILKSVLNQAGALAPAWVFVDEEANVSALTTTNATRPTVDAHPVGSDPALNLVAVLRGDANGSWKPAATASYEVLPDAYFTDATTGLVGLHPEHISAGQFGL